jgi:hypothetical protein
LLGRAEPAQGYRAFLGLALAHHQKHGHLGKGVLAHLIVDLLVAQIGFRAQARPAECGRTSPA